MSQLGFSETCRRDKSISENWKNHHQQLAAACSVFFFFLYNILFYFFFTFCEFFV